MGKKLIFLDIDGTLTAPGENIPPESAVKAIRSAQEKGHKVFLCTGRNYDMLSPLIPYGFDGIVGSSGGYVEVDGKVIYDKAMSREKSDYALDVLRGNGIFCTVECRTGSYTDEGLKEFLAANAGVGGNSELLRWRKQIETSLNIRPMKEYDGAPIYKVVFMSLGEENTVKPVEILSKDYAVVIQEANALGLVNGELVDQGVDKGTAVRKVAEYLGVSMEDTVGFGDSMNDLEMMQVTGYAICMDNGADGLKAVSDEVCPAVTDNGMYKAFLAHGWCDAQ